MAFADWRRSRDRAWSNRVRTLVLPKTGFPAALAHGDILMTLLYDLLYANHHPYR
jgi:hypothetical protein